MKEKRVASEEETVMVRKKLKCPKETKQTVDDNTPLTRIKQRFESLKTRIFGIMEVDQAYAELTDTDELENKLIEKEIKTGKRPGADGEEDIALPVLEDTITLTRAEAFCLYNLIDSSTIKSKENFALVYGLIKKIDHLLPDHLCVINEFPDNITCIDAQFYKLCFRDARKSLQGI